MDQIEEHISISGKWPLSAYTWKTERFLDRFTANLAKKKIFGARCSNCGTVFVPPVVVCTRCHSRMSLDKDQDWIWVSDMGTVIAYSISYLAVGDGLQARAPEKRPLFILVHLDGTDTDIFAELIDTVEEKIKVGMRVQVAWSEVPKGDLSDILFFRSL